ncbi:glycosyltransferase family 2 protein [Acinetobacter seifertii]|uniref:glycosyltransferase family 2 protein n=1 Tax=Acinetobacter seifertii TaxID=1530123 RepID=UPI00168AA621|nr:glycosyltransferase family 2 protein [Acinetobacter seifertii]MBU3084788.1 glycosyltransferase family 2 protein [Acinetobacter seifertii]QNX60677.1 glycosyltransferase family 2 protein [Acinetobacter seifertii]
MMSPLVSVVVPSYNHEKFLKERIDSIINQTFQDFELIILDDLSPDNSRDIIESYRTHPKVSNIVYNEINSGSTFFQWNKAVLELAKGEFIWIAESDDVAEITFLEKLVPILQENKNVVISYCQSSKMNSDGEITGNWLEYTNVLKYGEMFNQSFILDGEKYIENFLIYRNTIPNASAILFRKQIYIEIGGAQVGLRTNGDWDLWLKFLMLGDVYYHREELNKFRYHASSVIARATKNKHNKFYRKNNIVKQSIQLRNSFEKFINEECVMNKSVLNINSKARMNDKLMLGFTSLILFFIRK